MKEVGYKMINKENQRAENIREEVEGEKGFGLEKAPLCDYCYCTECYELYMTRAKYYMELGDKEAALSNIGRAYELCKNDGEILLIMKKIKEM